MRVLSVRQPWAWAILYAGKDIENRSWSANYRGPLAIHASMVMDPPDEWHLPRRVRQPEHEDLALGAILGIVDLVDVVESSRSKWFSGPYDWVLRNPRRLPRPLRAKGRLQLWSPSAYQSRILRTLGYSQTR